MAAEPGTREPAEADRRASRWSWWFGAALLATVIAVALRVSEGREFVRVVEGARPAWVLVAVALQAATYLAQGEIWRMVLRAAGTPVPVGTVYRLTLAKLFVDQALPSAGISGTVVVVRALERRGAKPAAVMAGVVVQTGSYYVAYVACLAAALVGLGAGRRLNPALLAVSTFFMAIALAITWAVLALPRRDASAPAARRAGRVPFLRRTLELFRLADPHLARRPRLLSAAILLQLAVVALDTGTVWTLIRALGADAPFGRVFESFMVASLLRTVAVSPGGLGTFEAASVLTLRHAGVDLAVALSATLLFRGLSFWLPMLPGLWASRATEAGSRRAPGG